MNTSDLIKQIAIGGARAAGANVPHMTHDLLMLLSKPLPMRTIEVNGEPYLERYFVGAHQGQQVWLHRFLRNDSEKHLHTHPWTATSYVLCGWYEEEQPEGKNLRNAASMPLVITPGRIHRISAVQPDTWTLMVVDAGRLESWFFIEDDGSRVEMQTSPDDWYLSQAPRAVL